MESLGQLVTACAGPGAAALIRANTRIGWLLFGVSVLLLVLNGAVLRRRRGRLLALWPVALLVAAHPGWWMSARGGDCGRMLLYGSVVATLTILPVSIFVHWRQHRIHARSGD